ncbi:GNAT family N-acetyltransferase [Acuticoccus kandeliae]|uniref:GNAT family N-acetyltransferase n=1 Tax=Acuticoccus kandeliae TaxID=2073160 RepID=UPI000D3E66B0|nr:GNAT family protein [Acuticoccus kandeliae]
MSDRPFADWTARPRPERVVLEGARIRMEPLDADRHTDPQWDAHRAGDPEGALWTYLGYGPFDTREAYHAHIAAQATSTDPLFYAVVPRATGKALGVMGLMRIDPANGVIEVGHICLAPGLRRTPEASEALLLLGNYVFESLGYRRFEWKCDSANAPSRRAATRYGFTFEGIFRQHMVTKGRNRDTAWFSILDGEWPERRAAFEAWLAPENFDADGRQRRALEEIRAANAG